MEWRWGMGLGKGLRSPTRYVMAWGRAPVLQRLLTTSSLLWCRWLQPLGNRWWLAM